LRRTRETDFNSVGQPLWLTPVIWTSSTIIHEWMVRCILKEREKTSLRKERIFKVYSNQQKTSRSASFEPAQDILEKQILILL
jgi:hypothetical protein